MEDQEIVDLYWGRDQRAIVRSEEKYGTYLRGIAWHILANREDCEECVNDTWLKAWNAMPMARPSILSAFLGAITRNLSLDRYRRKRSAKRGKGQVEYVFDELLDCAGGDEPARHLEERELVESLNRFLGELDPQKRVLFVRRYWYMDTVAELAGQFALSESNVKTSLFRIRQKLKEHLRREGFAV